MSEDRVVELRHPGSFSEDPLTAVLRSGAQRLLAQAVEMEVTAFIAAHGDLEDDAGRHRVVRHGHHRERRVQTGIGPVAVRLRDRGGAGEAARSVSPRRSCRPTSGGPSRSRSLALALPEGHLDGRLHRGPAALLGPDAPGLSASTITRLKDVWQGELARWEKRDLSARRYLYFWADGIYFQPRMEHDASWSSSAPTSGAARNCWQSPTAIARAPSRGASCCSISSGAASRWRLSWPSETGRSASGRPCARATARRANSAAGCTRPAF